MGTLVRREGGGRHPPPHPGPPLTSLPRACRKSTSASVKVVMEMDLTRWGGFSPRLREGFGGSAPPRPPKNPQKCFFPPKN